jgi:hypothetical protein
VDGKIQHSLRARDKERDFVRENAKAATKTFSLTGAWTQLDMNILSVSWSFQLTGGHRDVRNNFRVALSPALTQILKALAGLSMPNFLYPTDLADSKKRSVLPGWRE